MFNAILGSEQDTDRLGAALAEFLPAGAVVALIGPLGAGKTRFVQAVASALGVPPGAVTSPTFVLVNEYAGGRLPVYHFDVYRLKSVEEFLDLGPEEYFHAGGVTFIEWADRVLPHLPPDRIEATFGVVSETAREISLRGTNPKMEQLVDRLATALQGK
jgi:tRNA threonylcarbamoyladenosine biosynthesis protein TsaE